MRVITKLELTSGRVASSLCSWVKFQWEETDTNTITKQIQKSIKQTHMTVGRAGTKTHLGQKTHIPIHSHQDSRVQPTTHGNSGSQMPPWSNNQHLDRGQDLDS